MWRRTATPLIVVLAMLWASGPAYAGQVYVVRAGDTLWRISHRLGVRPADLAAANHLALAGTIHPGLRLTVPAAPAAGGPVVTPQETPALEHAVIVPRAPDAHPAAGPARVSAFSSAAVRIAMALVGRPYQWSGMGDGGFDCSGLVAHVFAALGRSLPHSSFAQYEVGTIVSRLALAPGDLVFFHTYSPGASHVGIYVGEDRFVHASYSRGVVISSLQDAYFRERFIGGRRP